MDHRNYPGADRGGINRDANQKLGARAATDPYPFRDHGTVADMDATEDNRPVADLSLEELIQRVARLTSERTGRRMGITDRGEEYSTTARRPYGEKAVDFDHHDQVKVGRATVADRALSPMELILQRVNGQNRDTVEFCHKLRDHADRLFGPREESMVPTTPMPEASNAFEAVLYALDAQDHALRALALEAGRNTTVA